MAGAALASVAFSASALAGNGDHVVVGPAGYALGQNTLVLAGGAPVPVVGPGDHVVICHALGEDNKDTYIQIAPSAGVVFGHAGEGHQLGEDIIPPFRYQPNGNGRDEDDSLAAGQNWDAAHILIYENGCAALPPAPVDVCPNLEGMQESVPAEMVKNEAGNCVPLVVPVPVADVCPNLEGMQETLPAGMVKNEAGNCVPLVVPIPTTDVCPNIAGDQSPVPAGMVKDSSGDCVTPTPAPLPVVVVTDACPNLEGMQASVPAGMVKDAAGSCLVAQSSTPQADTPAAASTPSTPAAGNTPAVENTPAAVSTPSTPAANPPTAAIAGVTSVISTKTPAAAKPKAKAKPKVKAKAKAKVKAKPTPRPKLNKAKIKNLRVLPFTP